MTEILTESFCERCGRRKPLSKIGTLGRGLKHFVADSGTSLDEALAVARSEQEQRSTQTALEAFHRTFNFCLSCRQYTCADCWNAVEGRCLTCAPTAESSLAATRVDNSIGAPPMDHAHALVDSDAIAQAEAAARIETERLTREAESAREAADAEAEAEEARLAAEAEAARV